MQSVVLCVDGSAHSDRVAEVVADLPEIRRLDVAVLAVDDKRTDAEGAVEAATKRLGEVGATVTTSILSGKPTEVILDFLKGSEPDLVALGTRGLTGMRRLRVGSTAGAVVQTAECSVLVACVEEPSE